MSVRSVAIAKKRLKNLILSDRISCTPDNITQMTTEIYQVISKYIEIQPENFQLDFTNTDIHIHYINHRRTH